MSASPTDPIILPVPLGGRRDTPAQILAKFREGYGRLPWITGDASRATLMAPVWSPSDSLARFEAQLRAVFTAHLKVLIAVETGEGTAARWEEYAAPYRHMRDYCLDWPVIGDPRIEPPLTGARLAALSHPGAARWAFGRPDIVLTRGGPKLVETNFDTAIGAFERPDDLWQLAARLFDPPAELVARGGPIDGVAASFVELAAGEPLEVVWVMREGDDLRREYEALAARLQRPNLGLSHRVFLAGDHPDPAEPTSGPRAAPRTLLHRACAIYTVNSDRARFAELFAALAARLSGCTVPMRLSHLESKLLLAWLSDPDARPTTLTAEERDALDALLPWTRLVKTLDGAELERVSRNRGDFVLKKTDSYQALDVFFGCNLSDDEWAARLRAKRGEPDVPDGGGINVWIVQERARPREFSLLEVSDAGLVERTTGVSCCPYLLGGRIRGLETWVMPFTPNHSMIHHMQYVPHFLGPA